MGIFSLALGTGTRIGGGTVQLTSADVTSTTGSPTITTTGAVTSYSFTASGTITLGKAGLCDVLLVAGGAGGSRGYTSQVYGAGGSGAGGHLYKQNAYVASGASTITIGAGGVGATTAEHGGPGGQGGSTYGVGFFAVGGGPGVGNTTQRGQAGSTGGTATNLSIQTATTGQGNLGGIGTRSGLDNSIHGGGGGGAGAVAPTLHHTAGVA